MGEENPSPKLKSRQCLFVLYPESQQDIIEYCQQNMPCAWCLHDKDTYTQSDFDKYVKKNGNPPEWQPKDLKKPHVHFVCRFKNPRYFSGVGKEIGVPAQTIRRCNNLYDAYVYLWHKKHPDKYQYPETDVGLHEFDVPSEHEGMSQAEDEQVQILLDMPSFQTFNELCRWVYENGCWSSFKKNYSMWRDIFIERKQANRFAPKNPDKLFSSDFLPMPVDAVDNF